MLYASRNRLVEISFTSDRRYGDPFREVDLSATFQGPAGQQWIVPAFWAGDGTWKVRFAPPETGSYRYASTCSDTGNPDLHGQTGSLQVSDYAGTNPLLLHGRLRVAGDRRHLEHVDGTPFLWLGDTWWMGLCRRLVWPEDFQLLTADRVQKGFSVIQIVAGLYPDMPAFDSRGANEAGYPMSADYSTVNPAYFDMADLRLAHLVRSGLVPCLVGCWGYFLTWMGVDRMKGFWRYLVARYGAYPVVWCLAGEATMPYYLSESKESDAGFQRQGWTELVSYVRQIDPFHNPITIHPTRYGHDQVDDPSLLDVDMLQTGHSGYLTLAPTVNMVTETLARQPRTPVLVGEVNYEGIMESNREEIQRFLFWSCLLSGAAGHTYGANGIWQLNTREKPYGVSPHGTSWGNTPWEDAHRLPGSGQLGRGKRLLERYPWWEFEPHPEWVEPHQTTEDRLSAYAAGIPGRVRIVYFPATTSWSAWRGQMALKGLETGMVYHGFYFDPKTGREYDLGTVMANAKGDYLVPQPPIFQDWVVVLAR